MSKATGVCRELWCTLAAVILAFFSYAGCSTSSVPEANEDPAAGGAPLSPSIGDGGRPEVRGPDVIGGAAGAPTDTTPTDYGGAPGSAGSAPEAGGDGANPVDCSFAATSADAEWTEVNDGLPNPVEVIMLTTHECALFAGTVDHGLYRFNDDTTAWESVFEAEGSPSPTVSSLLFAGEAALLGTDVGLFRSLDSGKTWSNVMAGFFANALLSKGAKIFAGANLGGIHVSTDAGVSWEPANAGLPSATTGVYSFALSGERLFAGTDKGIFVSDDDGASWTASSEGIDDTKLTSRVILSLGRFGANLVAGSFNRLLVSADDGMTWMEGQTGVAGVFDGYGFVQSEGRVFAATGNVVLPSRVLVSDDNGTSWAPLGTLTAATVRAIAEHGNQLFAGTRGAGIWRMSP